MVNKKVLRETYLEKRKFLSDEEYDRRNAALHRNFVKSVDLSSVKSVHTFLPIPENREVNTWLLINHIRTSKPDIRVFTSKSLAGARLEHYHLTEETRLKVSAWGIPEPVDAQPKEPESLDVIIIPLIICDKSGHRIGYGKGYYDRFLKKFPGALKVGVSLSPPLDRINFVDELDVAMHTCITPFKTYQF